MASGDPMSDPNEGIEPFEAAQFYGEKPEQAYEVVCDSRDPVWKEARTLGIGASEAATLLGLNPWKGLLQLYAEKSGAAAPPDLDDVELVQWGNRLEPVIIEAYRDRTQRFVDRGGLLLRSTRYPFALATLDAWTCTDEVGNYWPLEIKTTGASRGDEWANGPPENYRIQIHWQMLVTDKPRATIACLIGGQKLVWCDVERDETLIRRLVHHGVEFWDRVQRKEPPPPDGTESSKRALHDMYPRDDGDIVVLPAELLDVADELEICKEEEKRIALRKTTAENTLKAALAKTSRGVLPDHRVIAWTTEERKSYTVAATTRRVLRIQQPKGA